MNIYLHNTLSGKKELFKPLKRTIFGTPKVGMYHCGPTVYNYPHIGNLRAYVFADTLKRLMKASGYSVKQVINITDVGHLVSDADTGEDKMEKARKREHKSAWDIAKYYTDVFLQNLDDLNIDIKGTKFPRATDYIKEQIQIVKILEKKGFTYATSDGIYFDTSKFPAYGKLGSVDLTGIQEGQRIGVNDEKKNPTDFALWKFSPRNEKRDMEWDSPWGIGFPGWHIECSAMSKAILGQPFDIHTGGIDHIPVHHNNEIAQSEAAFDEKLAERWLHSAFINIEGGRMAKSENNFITLDTLREKGYSPMEYRYFLLTAHYRSPLNFSWEALNNASTAYKKLKGFIHALPDGGKIHQGTLKKVLEKLADDLHTPKALVTAIEILKDTTLSAADKKATILKTDELFGLNLSVDFVKTETFELPEEVQKLAKEREAARSDKNWEKSDELRDEIARLGYELKDTPEGQKIEKR